MNNQYVQDNSKYWLELNGGYVGSFPDKVKALNFYRSIDSRKTVIVQAALWLGDSNKPLERVYPIR